MSFTVQLIFVHAEHIPKLRFHIYYSKVYWCSKFKDVIGTKDSPHLHVQTGSQAHSASFKMNSETFLEVKFAEA